MEILISEKRVPGESPGPWICPSIVGKHKIKDIIQTTNALASTWPLQKAKSVGSYWRLILPLGRHEQPLFMPLLFCWLAFQDRIPRVVFLLTLGSACLFPAANRESQGCTHNDKEQGNSS